MQFSSLKFLRNNDVVQWLVISLRGRLQIPKIVVWLQKVIKIIANLINPYFIFSSDVSDIFLQSIFKVQWWKTRGKYYNIQSTTRDSDVNLMTKRKSNWTVWLSRTLMLIRRITWQLLAANKILTKILHTMVLMWCSLSYIIDLSLLIGFLL